MRIKSLLLTVIVMASLLGLSMSPASASVKISGYQIETVGISVQPSKAVGYWTVTNDGGVTAYGNSRFYGDLKDVNFNGKVVSITTTSDGRGYWLTASDGGVFAFGDAQFYGSLADTRLNEPVVGMTTIPNVPGYMLVAADGGVFAFGQTYNLGVWLMPKSGSPAVGITPTIAAGTGYEVAYANSELYDVVSRGGVAISQNLRLNAAIVGISYDPNTGYSAWLAASDGGVFTIGNAPFYGSLVHTPFSGKVTGIAASSGDIYYLVTSTGSVYNCYRVNNCSPAGQ